ncbi:MAG: hypothetical protein ACYTG4_14530 [Planctomycetota bacterium]|jgi:hypothetical protein
MAPYLLTILGLCLQILGGFFLAKAILWKAPRFMMRELIGVPVERYKTFRHFLAGRIEAITGFVLLSFGAGLQIAGRVQQADSELARSLVFWIVLSLVGIAIVAALLYYAIRRVARNVFLRIFAEQVKRRNWPFHDDPELLREVGEMLELPRQEDDTVDTYSARVREKLGLPPYEAPRGRRRDLGTP